MIVSVAKFGMSVLETCFWQSSRSSGLVIKSAGGLNFCEMAYEQHDEVYLRIPNTCR